MHSLFRFPALVSFVCCLASGFAEGAPQQLSVRTMALTDIELDPLFFATSGDEKWVPVEWSRRQPSRPAGTFVQDGVLSLFGMKTAPSGEVGYEVAYQVKIPPGAREILLFAWMSDGKLLLHPIADDFLRKRHDRWLLVNFSSKDIAFRVGDESKPVLVESKHSKLYTINVGENEPATILGQARIRGTEPKLFYSSYFPVKKGRRTIVLFTDDGDKMRTKLVADLFLPEKNPEKRPDSGR
jgi:hypothetical protein